MHLAANSNTREMHHLKARLLALLPYFKFARWGFVLAALCAAVSAAVEAAIPALLQPLLDKGFVDRSLNIPLVAGSVLGLFVLRSLSAFLADVAVAWAGSRVAYDLRQQGFAVLLRARSAFMTQHTASEISNTLIYQVQMGATQLGGVVIGFVRDVLIVLFLIANLLYLNWQLTLFIAAAFPFMALIMRVTVKRMHHVTKTTQKATDEAAYVVEETVLAQREIKLHNAYERQHAKFFAHTNHLRQLGLKSAVVSAAASPLAQSVAAVALAGVISVALWQSNSGAQSVGAFTAFIVAMLQLIAPIKHLSQILSPLTQAVTALERAVHFVKDTPTETTQGAQTDPIDRADTSKTPQGIAVRFENVSFSYAAQGSPGSSEEALKTTPALNGVNLEVPVNQTVALVGASGSGKTTLVHLLPRLLDPQSGVVEILGRNLLDWPLHSLREQFALVSQNIVLFDDSIAANVALGAGELDEVGLRRVQTALQAAALWEHVQTLPQGLWTKVGHNGSQLSGGQRQRLAMARAFYKEAPILILDEATSALDTQTERAIQDTLKNLMRGRTSLIIAHRLSTIEQADRIVVFEQGRVVETGSHAELLSAQGAYARLHELQFASAGSVDAAAPAPPEQRVVPKNR